LQYPTQHKIKYGDFAAQSKGHLAPSTALQIPITQRSFTPRVKEVHTREEVLSAEVGFVNSTMTLMRQALGKIRKRFPKRWYPHRARGQGWEQPCSSSHQSRLL